MDPVWTLFRRRTFSQLAYWCSFLGYNLRDRSLTNRFYFIYFCAFWLAWVVAMFALVGKTVADFFTGIGIANPVQLAVPLSAVIMTLWILVTLWQVTRRSPFVFSEEDAYLLCQTPVSRRKVGLAWFLQGWLGTMLPFAAGTTTLAFALVEWRFQHGLSIFKIFSYFDASGHALAIVLVLQMALQACLWGFGALRLHGRSQRTNQQTQRWVLLVLLLMGLILVASIFSPAGRASLLAAVSLPFQAAFVGGISTSTWAARAGVGVLFLAASLLWLAVTANKINLGQAAQETSIHAAVQLARSYWNYSLAETLQQRQRPVSTRSPSRLPARPGTWMLVRKDFIQSMRSIRLRLVANWLWVFGLGLGMFLTSNWTAQLVLGGLWTIALGSLATQRLRSDLARWWLLRSLPLRALALLRAEFGLAWGAGVLLSWLALAFSGKPLLTGLVGAALLPFLAANAILGSAQDILNHSEARLLLAPSIAEENVPNQNIGGVVRSLASVLVPLGMLCWSFTRPSQLIVGLAALPVAVFITDLNLRSVVSAYRWIR